MPDPQPPHLADALASFRAAADAAVERGHRIAGDAQAANAAFQHESDAIGQRSGPEHTADDLRRAALDYRTSRGLPVPTAEEPARRPPEDDDFSEYHVLRPL